MAKDRISVSCPKCHLGVTLEKGFFGWKTESCPKCGAKIRFDEARTQIMTCTGCGNDVVYDVELKNNCPICNRALVDNDDKHVSIECPDCKVVVELKRGLMGWKSTNCPKCGKKIKMKDNVTQIVTCPGCQRDVVYDLRRKNNCPSCNHALNDLASQEKRTSVPCPGCSLPVIYSPGMSRAICAGCGKEINPEQEAKRWIATTAGVPMDVRMTEEIGADEIIWKHPLNFFPMNARVIAKPGMTAVCVQGDQQAFAVNGQSVMLSETNLSADAYNYADSEQKYVYVDIYYVRNYVSGAFPWGGKATLVNANNQMSEFALNGNAELAEIADHAAFLRWMKFDTACKANSFRLAMDSRGMETMGEYAKQIRNAMHGCYDTALRAVRDRMNVPVEMLHAFRNDVQEEIRACANQKLLPWGVQLQNVVVDIIKLTGTTGYVDPLRARLEGSALLWRTDLMHVHVKDQSHAYVQLQMNGSCYIRIEDEVKLNRHVSAALWRDSAKKDSCAHDEIAAYTGNMLGSMFTALFQQLIDDMDPPMETLQVYAGYLKGKAEQLLNAPGDYLEERGLSASQLVVNVKVVQKSEAYLRHETLANEMDKGTTDAKLHEFQKKMEVSAAQVDIEAARKIAEMKAEDEIAGLKTEQKLDDARTDNLINQDKNDIRRESAKDELKHEQELKNIKREIELTKAKAELSYERWQEQKRLDEEKEKQAYQQARFRQGQEQAMQIDKAMHDKALQDIVRAVEASNLDWREKLDAYDRLTRSRKFQDELEQSNARARSQTDNQAYAAQQALKINADTARTMDDIEYQAKKHEEEFDQARFARDLELRRQKLAEEMERLNAEFEQSRKQREEETKRFETQQENETLRLMLEYLAKVGDQQVTQATMQAHIAEAKAAAERAYQDKCAAEARQQAEARHQEQLQREDVMSNRAFALTQDMLHLQGELEKMEKENKRAYDAGRAMVDANDKRYQDDQVASLKNQMKELSDAVKNMQSAVGTNSGSDFGGWISKLLGGLGSLTQPMVPTMQPVMMPAQPVVVAAQPAVMPSQPVQPAATNTRLCVHCGKPISVDAYKCPHCNGIG